MRILTEFYNRTKFKNEDQENYVCVVCGGFSDMDSSVSWQGYNWHCPLCFHDNIERIHRDGIIIKKLLED